MQWHHERLDADDMVLLKDLLHHETKTFGNAIVVFPKFYVPSPAFYGAFTCILWGSSIPSRDISSLALQKQEIVEYNRFI